MSLILEALKKLEREKEAPARGVVVVGATPWTGARPERRLGLFLVGLALGGGLIAMARWRQETAEGTTSPASAAPTLVVPRSSLAPASPAAAVRETDSPARAPRSAPSPRATPAASPVPPPAFVLQAISERDGRPVAIVNDRLVREGDSIDGARIARIAKDEVELEVAGRRVLLRF